MITLCSTKTRGGEIVNEIQMGLLFSQELKQDVNIGISFKYFFILCPPNTLAAHLAFRQNIFTVY